MAGRRRWAVSHGTGSGRRRSRLPLRHTRALRAVGRRSHGAHAVGHAPGLGPPSRHGPYPSLWPICRRAGGRAIWTRRAFPSGPSHGRHIPPLRNILELPQRHGIAHGRPWGRLAGVGSHAKRPLRFAWESHRPRSCLRDGPLCAARSRLFPRCFAWSVGRCCGRAVGIRPHRTPSCGGNRVRADAGGLSPRQQALRRVSAPRKRGFQVVVSRRDRGQPTVSAYREFAALQSTPHGAAARVRRPLASLRRLDLCSPPVAARSGVRWVRPV